MTDHHDIEETLKQFEHEPAPGSKRAVMNAYRDAFGARPRGGFWRRPVPLYAAAALIVVLAGASFLAGQRSSLSIERTAIAPADSADGAVTSQEIQWRPAQNDLL